MEFAQKRGSAGGDQWVGGVGDASPTAYPSCAKVYTRAYARPQEMWIAGAGLCNALASRRLSCALRCESSWLSRNCRKLTLTGRWPNWYLVI